MALYDNSRLNASVSQSGDSCRCDIQFATRVVYPLVFLANPALTVGLVFQLGAMELVLLASSYFSNPCKRQAKVIMLICIPHSLV